MRECTTVVVVSWNAAVAVIKIYSTAVLERGLSRVEETAPSPLGGPRRLSALARESYAPDFLEID